MSKMLEKVKSPRDLDGMSYVQLEQLAGEIRKSLISTVSSNGGHLASNLGVVELTLALHRVFHMPEDKIVFDVGHQSYIHKMITGRYDRFSTLRSYGGLSGFPKRSESPYDCFETGHASTAISAALGLARARDYRNEHFDVIAVVGDGALTGGMCYEALNDAGNSKTKMIVVLNDNEMSIAPNVGALSPRKQVFSTATDNQPSVDIHVLQGERDMAADNKTLGRFELGGIPAAPRGVPKIEVAFDIDANGIVNVSAKDLGTGKEQKITITSSGTLSKDEVDRMVKEAEANAEADKKRKEGVEIRNQADSLIYQAEKTIKDMEGKGKDDLIAKVKTAMETLKTDMKGNDNDKIKASTEALTKPLYELSAELYKQAEANRSDAGAAGASGTQGGEQAKKPEDDVVDAEVVDDKK